MSTADSLPAAHHREGSPRMVKLSELPTEVLQRITRFLPYRDRAKYVQTHKPALDQFYPPYEEQQESFRLWGPIVKEISWLREILALGLIPVLIGKDIEGLATAKKDSNLSAVLTFVMIRKRRRSRSLTDPWISVLEGIPSKLRCTAYNNYVKEAKFPGFTLYISVSPTSCHVNDPTEILQSDGKETKIAYFNDKEISTLHTTSRVEVAEHEITIRDNEGHVFEVGYTPASHWSRDPVTGVVKTFGEFKATQ
ncbi:hypothetical protein V3481_019581 [Fusarium oxysporum f. sp. vasinfectum]